MDEAAFEGERPRLQALAYRMLGSQAEAEDVLQEAWLRWRNVNDAQSPRGYLTAMVTRLCVDQLKSARARREVYVGPWLPEPVRTTVDEEPDRESISLAFLRIMERLGAVERAVFLLHQVFDYSHAEVARIVDKDEAAVRQILHRARERVRAERPRFAASREEHARLLTRERGGPLLHRHRPQRRVRGPHARTRRAQRLARRPRALARRSRVGRGHRDRRRPHLCRQYHFESGQAPAPLLIPPAGFVARSSITAVRRRERA